MIVCASVSVENICDSRSNNGTIKAIMALSKHTPREFVIVDVYINFLKVERNLT